MHKKYTYSITSFPLFLNKLSGRSCIWLNEKSTNCKSFNFEKISSGNILTVLLLKYIAFKFGTPSNTFLSSSNIWLPMHDKNFSLSDCRFSPRNSVSELWRNELEAVKAQKQIRTSFGLPFRTGRKSQ